MEEPHIESMDDRLKKEVGTAGRRSREADDRAVTERRDLSDDDRIDMFRQTLFNDVLPDLPPIPGYHVCWLSTSHQSDSLAKRHRLGYTPIQAHEVPGMEYASQKTGEYGGLIMINEMLAHKLPMNLYMAYMQEAHHRQPAEQASMIAATVDAHKEQAARDGGEIMEGDGMDELRRAAPTRGVFSE